MSGAQWLSLYWLSCWTVVGSVSALLLDPSLSLYRLYFGNLVGCILNDELLESLIETKYTNTQQPRKGKGRGGRGKGKGKAKGGRGQQDPKMSFRDF